MSLGFCLGALIPNEVWPYQWLPLLPLVLLLVVRGIERRRFGSLAVLAVLLLGFYRAPCDLIFPNIWTVAAIGIFVLGVWENRLFRSEPVAEREVSHATERSGQLTVDWTCVLGATNRKGQTQHTRS